MLRGFTGLTMGAALALAGCGPAGESTAYQGSTLIAFASNFENFREWDAYPVPSTSMVDNVHLSGPRTEYINQLPPHGSHTFPVGTIIVKESEVGALPDRKIFAMVKRGGDYNSAGATDWEWFELQNVDEHSVVIIWRGVGPPAGEMYGGDPKANCNSCHEVAKSNDFVHSVGLDLGKF